MESAINYMFLGAWLLANIVLAFIIIMWGTEGDNGDVTLKTMIMFILIITTITTTVHFTNL